MSNIASTALTPAQAAEITSSLAVIQAAVTATSSVSGLSGDAVAQIQGQIATLDVSTLAPAIADQDAALGAMAMLGGLAVGASPAANAAALSAAATVAQQLPQLLIVQSNLENVSTALSGNS
jgi:hypothetical protein